MPNYDDTYEDEDGNVWQFDPPYDDDPEPYDHNDDDTHWSGCDTWEEYWGLK